MSHAKAYGISGFFNQKSGLNVVTLLKRRKQVLIVCKRTWQKQDDIINTGMTLRKTTNTSSKAYLLYFTVPNVPIGFVNIDVPLEKYIA